MRSQTLSPEAGLAYTRLDFYLLSFHQWIINFSVIITRCVCTFCLCSSMCPAGGIVHFLLTSRFSMGIFYSFDGKRIAVIAYFLYSNATRPFYCHRKKKWNVQASKWKFITTASAISSRWFNNWKFVLIFDEAMWMWRRWRDWWKSTNTGKIHHPK